MKLIIVLIFFSQLCISVPFEGHKILIAGPSPLAAKVGKNIARQGGNVADVAVAVGLTLTVTGPYFAALGGGGFGLIKMDDQVRALDFREVAPEKAGPDFYLKKPKSASVTGGAAVGVPGFPAGLWEIHKKYGKLPWKKLFKEPIVLAQKGFEVSGEWARYTKRSALFFNRHAKRHLLKNSKHIYKPGEVLKQPALAKALKLFRDKGADGFYKGPVARDISKSVIETGGVLSEQDLANYKVKWREPISTKFLGYDVHLMPPPSSGGVIIKQALSLIEKLKITDEKPLSVMELHLLAEVMNHSFRTRTLLSDPEFNKLPLKKLFAPTYIAKMASNISRQKTKKLAAANSEAQIESLETTHFSVMDAKGHSIAITVTLNGGYGSKVVTDIYGIALNNEMDDFTTRPGKPNMYGLVQGKVNQVEPGKRPLSSMSPTIVTKDNKAVLSIGSPGGPRIINSVLQVMYRILVNHWDVDQAIQAPRIHHQFLPFKLFVDRRKFSPEVLFALKAKGHEIMESSIAKVYAIRVNENGWLEASFDSRGEGGADGF